MTEVRKGKVPGPGGQLKDAVSVEVIESKEPWSEYQLADGTLIKMKYVVTEMWRVENEYDNEGNPFYVGKANPVTTVVASESIKRKENA